MSINRFIPFTFLSASLGFCLHATVPIHLPPGFKATVMAEEVGHLRHVVVADDGIVYASLRRLHEDKGLVALRDNDGDGVADEIEYFGAYGGRGTGLGLYDGYLYYSTYAEVYRQKLTPGQLVPTSERETIVTALPRTRSHDARTLAFDGEGRLFVNVGAPSNACQEPQRTPGAAGQQPCPQLLRTGGVWVFDAATPGQTQMGDGKRWATGLRHAMALDWHPAAGALYSVVHGRDQLDTLWPEIYTARQNADLPGEEFQRLEEGTDGGWPYTYWDGLENVRRVAPEYGGDGKKIAEPGQYADPLMAFPAHWAPNDLVFYTGEAFPEAYHHGAFVAFHGSWNRAPYPQLGYKVAFIPMDAEGEVTGAFQEFATGFGGEREIMTPRNAAHRPCGVAVTPDGALIVVDSQAGWIWRIDYTGEAEDATDETAL